MMEGKMKIRIDEMEARWEQQQVTMTRQVDRVTQIERITNDRVAQVHNNIKTAETTLAHLTTQTEEANKVLTMVKDQISEANNAIHEVDDVINTMADAKEANEISRRTFIDKALDIKEGYEQDARAVKKAKQSLNRTKNKLLSELASATPPAAPRQR
jgi:chromosome segregation ATPase